MNRTKVRIVADTSAMRSASLVDYLSKTSRHEIIIPQLVLAECTQGSDATNAKRSLVTVARFSAQAHVLSSDSLLHRLKPRRNGIQSRLIDSKLTRRLRTHLSTNLAHLNNDDAIVHAMFAHDRRQIETLMAPYLKIAKLVHRQMLNERDHLTKHEMRLLRNENKICSSLVDKIETRLNACTARVLKDSGLDLNKLTLQDGFYSIPWRMLIFVEALSIHWAVYGGLEGKTPEELANDIKDMSHLACASFFDGLLTLDKRMLSAFEIGRVLIRVFDSRYFQYADGALVGSDTQKR